MRTGPRARRSTRRRWRRWIGWTGRGSGGGRAQARAGGIVQAAPPRGVSGRHGAARSTRGAAAPDPGSAALPAGANWKAVTIAEIATDGHQVGVDVGVGVGARAGRDDVRDHPDRLVDQDRAVLRERGAGPQQVDVGLAASSGWSSTAAAMPAKTCSSETRMGSSAGRSRRASTWTLELRPPGGGQRLLLAAEVVVERPDGHVRGGGDVVGGHRVQATLRRARPMTARLMAARVSAFLRSRRPVVSFMSVHYHNRADVSTFSAVHDLRLPSSAQADRAKLAISSAEP